MPDVRAAARRWAATPRPQPDALGQVCAADCVFRVHPFREPHHGVEGVLEYARWAFESEQSADPWFGEPVVDGDQAVVEYRALVVSTDGVNETIAGCAFLAFGPDGKVTSERDYWAAGEGHRLRPESQDATGAEVSPPG